VHTWPPAPHYTSVSSMPGFWPHLHVSAWCRRGRPRSSPKKSLNWHKS
jgi:hypothetical protein